MDEHGKGEVVEAEAAMHALILVLSGVVAVAVLGALILLLIKVVAVPGAAMRGDCEEMGDRGG